MNSHTSFPRFTRTLCGVTLVIGLLAATRLLAATTSINVVGYVNKELPFGYTLVANPLDNVVPFGNTIPSLFSSSIGIPFGPGGAVLKWTGSGYSAFVFNGSGWTDGAGNPVAPVTLAVGEGAVVRNFGPLLTNTFIGEVRGLDTSAEPFVLLPVVTPPPGIYLRGRVAPMAPASFEHIMGRAPIDGDAVMKLDAAGNPLLSYFAFGDWVDPLGGNTAPTLSVAESAFFDITGNQFAGFVLPNTVVVPEPATCAILGLGLLSAALYRSRVKGH